MRFLDAHEAAYSQAPPSTLLAFLGQSLLKLQGNPYFRNFHLSFEIESAWTCSDIDVRVLDDFRLDFCWEFW